MILSPDFSKTPTTSKFLPLRRIILPIGSIGPKSSSAELNPKITLLAPKLYSEGEKNLPAL